MKGIGIKQNNASYYKTLVKLELFPVTAFSNMRKKKIIFNQNSISTYTAIVTHIELCQLEMLCFGLMRIIFLINNFPQRKFKKINCTPSIEDA